MILVSFELYDVDKTGEIKPQEMKFVLNAMNNSIGHFGEKKTLNAQDIEQLVKSVFEESDTTHKGTLSHEEYANAVLNHPILAAYVDSLHSN